MNRIVFILLMIISSAVYAQKASVIKITDFEQRIKNNSDTTYILNFWATWCAPCVKELPYFDSINTVYKNRNVKVILISMDFKEDLNSKLLPFISKKNIKSEVCLLDEMNGNYFIPKVAEQWSGAIPATLIVNNKYGVRHFFEKSLTYEFLKSEIDSIK